MATVQRLAGLARRRDHARLGEAMIPATDEGLLRGDGVFEVIRVYDGRPVRLRGAHGPARALGRRTSACRSTSRRSAPTPTGCSPTPAPGPTTSCCGSCSRAAGGGCC